MMNIIQKKIQVKIMYKKTMSYLMVFSFLVLVSTACQSQSKQMDSVIEKINKITAMEQKFFKAGEQIQELEIQELECYEKIFSFKVNEIDKRQSTAKKAIRLLNERKGMIDEESKLIHKIDIKIEELQTINIETKDDEFRKDVNEFILTWKKRTNKYDQLNKKYKEAIKIDLTIYNLLSQKKVELKNVKNKTKNTNVVYKDVIKINDQLNLYTQKLNNQRKDIYEKFGK
jgi:Putative cell-wall binding lipoprotein